MTNPQCYPVSVEAIARAIAENGFGRPWDDFLPVNAHDTDQGDLIEYAQAAVDAMCCGAVAQCSPNPVLVKALNDLHVWCEVEGCGDQAEIIKDAFIAAGITEYRCANCDGAGEWDEGPLPATSSAQISPDYRHVVCSDCEGKGAVALTSTNSNTPGDQS
jgi:hypothetical protein